MSKPIRCCWCMKLVGTTNQLGHVGLWRGVKPKKGKKCQHPAPIRTEKQIAYGHLWQIRVYYPETRTESRWKEYRGNRRSAAVAWRLALQESIYFPAQNQWIF